ALDTSIEMMLKLNTGPLNINLFAASKDRPHPQSIAHGIMFPNFDLSITLSSPAALTTDDIRLIQDGKILIYFFGEARYSHIFKRRHATMVCGYYAPALKKFNVCEQYNRAD